jgi:hypothetical protein
VINSTLTVSTLNASTLNVSTIFSQYLNFSTGFGSTLITDTQVVNSTLRVSTLTVTTLNASTIYSQYLNFSTGFGSTLTTNNQVINSTLTVSTLNASTLNVSTIFSQYLNFSTGIGSTLITDTQVVNSTLVASSINATSLYSQYLNFSSLTGSALNIIGNATFQNTLTVNGSLAIGDVQTVVNATTLQVRDNSILIADDNTNDLVQTGIEIKYKPSNSLNALYAGIKRAPASGLFTFFKDATNRIAISSEANRTRIIYGEWIQLQLATASPITSYRLAGRAGYSTSKYPVSWYLVASTDNSSWIVLDIQTNAVGFNAYQLPSASVSYSYYRVIFTKLYESTVNIGGFILYNYGSSLFGPNSDYTVQSNVLRFNGQTVCTTTQSWSNSEVANVQGISSDGINPPNISALLPTSDGYNKVEAGNPYYTGFKVITGSDKEYNSTYNAVQGTETIVAGTINSLIPDIYAGILADSFVSASDKNLKKNIVELPNALENVEKMRGVYHEWIDENQSQNKQIGVIAQEVQAVYPELVQESENGYLSVNYPKLTAVLLQSIKEMNKKMKRMDETIEELKAMIK